MSDKWYVVPAGFALRHPGGSEWDEEASESAILYVHPVEGSSWPSARSLPRRMRGKLKR